TADNVRYVRSGYVQKLQNAPSDHLRQLLANDDWENAWSEDDPMAVIPARWVDLAMDRWTPRSPATLDAIGVDPARGGRDRTVVFPRHGDYVGTPMVRPGRETPDGPAVAALVLGAYRPGCIVFIDGIGIGGAVYDA